MSDMVTVKVLRMHSNDLGTHTEGETYQTDKQHAAALADRNLVSVVGAAAEAKAEPAPENKSEPAPHNKAAPAPATKGKPKATKAASAPENKAG